tara:strand:+ start:653 stop:823 length:171 start_codon:yes stop_codon:yes gene_type:complete
MSVTINNHNGIITISDIVEDEYFNQSYMGYSIKECKRKFKEYVKEELSQRIVEVRA